MGDKLARALTGAMATWTFAGVFLLLCGLEIWFNHTPLIPQAYKFDPQTIILNLFLSLIAAIQGSIIMIAQKQADQLRDDMMKYMIRMEKKVVKLEQAQIEMQKQILEEVQKIKES